MLTMFWRLTHFQGLALTAGPFYSADALRSPRIGPFQFQKYVNKPCGFQREGKGLLELYREQLIRCLPF